MSAKASNNHLIEREEGSNVWARTLYSVRMTAREAVTVGLL